MAQRGEGRTGGRLASRSACISRRPDARLSLWMASQRPRQQRWMWFPNFMDKPRSKPVYKLDEVDRQWATDGAKVLARVAQGDCHLDNEGWWVETSTGNLIGIDPQTDRPILSEAEAEQWRKNAKPFSEACSELHASIQRDKVKWKTIPAFKTNKQAEQFVAKADLSEYDLRGRPMSEVFPQFAPQMKRRGRPKSSSPKQIITIRLDRDVLERLKADGSGWQTRVNAILRKTMGLK